MAKVLVVDDDCQCRAVLCAMLANMGHVVHSAENGEEAWTSLSSISVDLLITDVMMPVVDGPELVRRVRESFGFSMPVIAVSGCLFSENISEILLALGVIFLAKPIRYSLLMETVNRLLPVVNAPPSQKS